MRRQIILAATLLFCLSCTIHPFEDNIFQETVFSICGDTKATSGLMETAVNHWAVMVFDTGNSDAFYYAVSNSGSDITCTVRKDRPYRAYAIVNYPKDGQGAFDPSLIESESQLNEYTSYLSGNSPSSLTMFGNVYLGAPPTGRTNISVSRLCSKISIQKITIDLTDPAYEGHECILNALYLTNVYCAGSFCTDHDSPLDEPALWYNVMGWHGSGSIESMDNMLGDRGLSQSIPDGSSYTVTHSFYAYPNATEDDSRSETWSPRCTRLVIEATLCNKRYYYPITIPAMRRNYSYIVTEAIIKGPGSLDPEIEIPGVLDVSLTITTNTWDSVYYISEGS